MAAIARTELPRERARSGSRKAGKGNDHREATEAGLDLLRVLGWMVVHDVVVPGARGRVVDHVAAGPSGVYVINTVPGEGALTARDEALLCGGVDQAAELADVSAAAVDLRTVLEGHPVAPLLCFVRGEEFTAFIDGVAVCATENVLDVLTSQPERFDQAAQAAIARVLNGALSAADVPRLAPPAPAGRADAEGSGKHRHVLRFGRGRKNAEPEMPPAKSPEVKAPEAKAPPAAPMPAAAAPAAPAAPVAAPSARDDAAVAEAMALAARTEQERQALEAEKALVAQERARAEQALEAERSKVAEEFARVEEVRRAAEQSLEAEKAQIAEELARIEAERRSAEEARGQLDAETEQQRVALEAERAKVADEIARIEAERAEAAQALAAAEAERDRVEAERDRVEAERDRAESESREAAESRRQAVLDEQRTIAEERRAAAEERAKAAEERAAAEAEQERIAAERRRVVEERRLAEEAEARAVAERKRAAAERKAAEVAQERAEQERAATARRAADRAARERHLTERAAADVAAQRGEPVESVVAQAMPEDTSSTPLPARFAMPPKAPRQEEAPKPVLARTGVKTSLKLALFAAIVVGLVAGVMPRVPDAVAWGKALIYGAAPSGLYGEQLVAGANAYHPDLTIVAGTPTPVRATGGQVPKNADLYGVPVSVLNGGGDAWVLRAGSSLVAIDSLGVAHRALKNINGTSAGKPLAATTKIGGGGNASGTAVFAIPQGRSVAKVELRLSQVDKDTMTWSLR